MSRIAPGIRIETYSEDALEPVLDLLTVALGPGPAGRRSPEFFRWKHLENPFGPSFMLLALDGEKVVGLRAFLRWELRAGDRTITAVRAVDTATHPEYRGRGIFSRLTREALDVLRSQVDLVFNTPNASSGPGYLKMGWVTVGRLPLHLRVRRPLRLARAVPSLRGGARAPESARGHDRAPVGVLEPEVPEAAATLGDPRMDGLLRDLETPADRLWTPRTAGYLRWRYGAPGLGYRAATAGAAQATRGLAIFRIRPRGSLVEASVAEVLVGPGDDAGARALLRRVAAAAPVDHVVSMLPAHGSARKAALRAGFFSVPGGPTLMVNPLRDGLAPDPRSRSAWALSLGDVEVF